MLTNKLFTGLYERYLPSKYFIIHTRQEHPHVVALALKERFFLCSYIFAVYKCWALLKLLLLSETHRRFKEGKYKQTASSRQEKQRKARFLEEKWFSMKYMYWCDVRYVLAFP